MTKKVESEVKWTRTVPLRYEADVAVIGGGMAGVTAAVAAAREGAKVILIERFAEIGGNATTGGVGAFCGETAGQGRVFDEIIADLEKFQAVGRYVPYPKADHRLFNHAILAVVLQELLLRHKVKLLLHTQFIDVSVTDDGKIGECIVCGKSGPEALRAKQYIDCTGEAQVAHMAGFATMKGRPGDQIQLPMSLMFFIRHVEEEDKRNEIPEGWFAEFREKAQLPMTTIWPNGPRGNAIKVKIPMFDATDTESMTAAEVHARRRMMEVLDYYQRVEQRKWLLDHSSPQIGIREGRRVVGEYFGVGRSAGGPNL
ncbi:MAG: dependent oxidoreductase [Paenibacillus sp.]|jgi:ribulose 1,5-bisphosphate synthetase/thiazole synthase|nr:dependent oxidoreductase [Paenibacillus sp.]